MRESPIGLASPMVLLIMMQQPVLLGIRVAWSSCRSFSLRRRISFFYYQPVIVNEEL